MTTDVYTATGSWTCPAGVTEAWVRCWGGGGAGGGVTATVASGSVNGGGGAGGYYAEKTAYTVTPGNAYTVTVGATKTGLTTGTNHGNDTWFHNNTTGILAKGGRGGASVSIDGVTGSGGGTTAGSIGDTIRAGGTGANSLADSANSGSGGGGAGSTGAGGNAGSGTTGGTAGAGQGGIGGAGRTTAGVGAAGAVYGGGGSGARTTSTTDFAGGNGAAGRVEVEYTIPPVEYGYVKATTGTGNGTAVTTTAFTGTTETGNLIYVVVGYQGGVNGITSITDNKGNTYVKVLSRATGLNIASHDIWYAKDITGGSGHTVTANAATKPINLIAAEYAGLDLDDPFDISSSAAGTATSVSSSATGTTEQNDEIVVGGGAGSMPNTTTYALGTGYGDLTQVWLNDIKVAHEWKAVTAAAAQTATYTLSASQHWSCSCVTFKKAATGPPSEQLAGFIPFFM